MANHINTVVIDRKNQTHEETLYLDLCINHLKENKVSNSKVFIFFDWVWRLMVLNLLTIVFSLGIITIMPAICATFKTIKDTKENYTPKIFKPFLQNFHINLLYFFKVFSKIALFDQIFKSFNFLALKIARIGWCPPP